MEERAIAARYLSGEVGRKLGVGYATVHELAGAVPPAAAASLQLVEVDRRFAAIAGMSGTGSNKARKDAYGALLAQATLAEQRIARGDRRRRAAARRARCARRRCARARGRDAERGRALAYMLAGEIGVVAEAVLADGAAGAARFGLTLFRPVLPMLAQTAEDAAEAIATLRWPGRARAQARRLPRPDPQGRRRDSRVLARAERRHESGARGRRRGARASGAAPDPRRRGDRVRRRTAGRCRSRTRCGGIGASAGSARSSLSLFDVLLVDDQTMLAHAARERFAALGALAPAHARAAARHQRCRRGDRVLRRARSPRVTRA